jgi:hypothetical protein
MIILASAQLRPETVLDPPAVLVHSRKLPPFVEYEVIEALIPAAGQAAPDDPDRTAAALQNWLIIRTFLRPPSRS